MLSRNAAKERNSQNNRDRRIRENYRSDKEIKTRENQRRNERERSRDKIFFRRYADNPLRFRFKDVSGCLL